MLTIRQKIWIMLLIEKIPLIFWQIIRAYSEPTQLFQFKQNYSSELWNSAKILNLTLQKNSTEILDLYWKIKYCKLNLTGTKD